MAPHEIQPASDPTASRKQVVRTKLDLRSILGRTLTKSLEEILLDPFGEMIIGCQSVVITGVQHVSLPRVESLREIMSAEAVFTKAMVWKMLRLAKIMKWKAYDLIRKVDYERAMDSYMLLIDAHQSSFLFRLPRNSYAGDTGVVASLLLRTMIDAAVTIAWLGLKLGDFKQVHDFQHIGQEIGGFLTNLPLPENMLMPDQGRFPPCIQGGAWLDLLLDVLTRGNVYYTLEQGVSGLTNMKQGMIQFGAIVSHISCDLTLLQGLLNNHMALRKSYDKVPLHASKPLDLTSARKLSTPKIFETPLPAGFEKIPDCIDGFVDKEHLEAMLAADPERMTKRKENLEAWVASHPQISDQDRETLLS